MKKLNLLLVAAIVAGAASTSYAKPVASDDTTKGCWNEETGVVDVGGKNFNLNWESFDIDKGETVKFINNSEENESGTITPGTVINTIKSAKATLAGAIESYKTEAASGNEGGNIVLLNSKGFSVAKTFSFKGDSLSLGLNSDVLYKPTFGTETEVELKEDGTFTSNVATTIEAASGKDLNLSGVTFTGLKKDVTFKSDKDVEIGAVTTEATLTVNGANVKTGAIDANGLDIKASKTITFNGDVDVHSVDAQNVSTFKIEAGKNIVLNGNINVATCTTTASINAADGYINVNDITFTDATAQFDVSAKYIKVNALTLASNTGNVKFQADKIFRVENLQADKLTIDSPIVLVGVANVENLTVEAEKIFMVTDGMTVAKLDVNASTGANQIFYAPKTINFLTADATTSTITSEKVIANEINSTENATVNFTGVKTFLLTDVGTGLKGKTSINGGTTGILQNLLIQKGTTFAELKVGDVEKKKVQAAITVTKNTVEKAWAWTSENE